LNAEVVVKVRDGMISHGEKSFSDLLHLSTFADRQL
jgi:hypothetical protein